MSAVTRKQAYRVSTDAVPTKEDLHVRRITRFHMAKVRELPNRNCGETRRDSMVRKGWLPECTSLSRGEISTTKMGRI